jgi:hypothetical protein
MIRSRRDVSIAKLARGIAGREESRSAIPLVPILPRRGIAVGLGLDASPRPPSLRRSATLASPDSAYVLRVVSNPKSGVAEAFLMHSEAASYRYAMLRIEGWGGDFLTDERGRVALPVGARPSSITSLRVIPAVAVYATALPSGGGSIQMSPVFARNGWEKSKISLSVAGIPARGLLTIRLSEPRGLHARRIAIAPTEGLARIVVPHAGTAVFAFPSDGREITILLYE